MPSPNMNLPIPTVSVTAGPQYASDVNASLSKIDAHNHTTGQGSLIPTAALNINSSLPMNNYGLLNASLLNLTAQGVIPTSGSVYRNSDDLWYVDGSGNNVRITQGGSVAVSGAIGFTGLPSGTASASYSTVPPNSSTFIFQSATNTAANIDGGSIRVRELVANAKAVTIASPLALANDYTLTLPTANPAVDSFLQVSAVGAMSFYSLISVLTPVGSMLMYGGSVAPTGWLLCNGSEVSQVAYAALFAVLGTSFNTGGEAPGNFRLPNFQRRTAVGAGGAASPTLGNLVGNSGGTETVTLSTSEIPAHTHTDSGHSHNITPYNSGNGNIGLVGPFLLGFSAAGAPIAGAATSTASGTANLQNTGGGQAHNNLQPSLVVNYIIKY